jgi:hypothetical protein
MEATLFGLAGLLYALRYASAPLVLEQRGQCCSMVLGPGEGLS